MHNRNFHLEARPREAAVNCYQQLTFQVVAPRLPEDLKVLGPSLQCLMLQLIHLLPTLRPPPPPLADGKSACPNQPCKVVRRTGRFLPPNKQQPREPPIESRRARGRWDRCCNACCKAVLNLLTYGPLPVTRRPRRDLLGSTQGHAHAGLGRNLRFGQRLLVRRRTTQHYVGHSEPCLVCSRCAAAACASKPAAVDAPNSSA